MEFRKVLLEKIKGIMENWTDDGIYAVSFFVEPNEDHICQGISNLSEFMISYNTEEDCDFAGPLEEERWNYACWSQNEEAVIEAEEDCKESDMLLSWYQELGITEIGSEPDENDEYDEEMNYIGKGPKGHYELLMLAADIARQLQEEGFLQKRFHKEIPIIVHGLEYAWYDIEATKIANPHREAHLFLEYAKQELGYSG